MDLLDAQAVGVCVVLQDELLQVEKGALVLHMLPDLRMHLVSSEGRSASRLCTILPGSSLALL